MTARGQRTTRTLLQVLDDWAAKYPQRIERRPVAVPCVVHDWKWDRVKGEFSCVECGEDR